MTDDEEDTNEPEEELSETEQERQRQPSEVWNYRVREDGDTHFVYGLQEVLLRCVESGAMWFDDASRVADLADESHRVALVEIIVHLSFER